MKENARFIWCECRGTSDEAFSYVRFLERELEQVTAHPFGGGFRMYYLRFPLTDHNRAWVLETKSKRLMNLHFFFMRPKDWQAHACSHVMVRADNLWLEFKHELCFEFIDGLWSKSPRITALPYSMGAKRPPGLGITDSYYLPFQIVRVPGLEAWLESASSSFCAVPFPQSRRNRKAIYDAYPDADQRCRELISWQMDEAVWKLTDYALIVPRHSISLANSATIEGRVPGGGNEGKPIFRIRDLMGTITVPEGALQEGVSYISAEVDAIETCGDNCDRETIYPTELVASLFAVLNGRQKGKLQPFPVSELSDLS
ncbi:MAG: hypothetical protein ACK5ZK_02005 [Armatimonadota bacterium]|jgi:hypothetical protein|nr:hypothetical protein [Fimbriimonadaceae bacterium]MCZ8139807.1 hypothetical protein [Fimbriimonadaceae bacterium]